MNTVAIVQARLGSTRLPGKVLYELSGVPMIVFMLDRAARAKRLDSVVLATGEGAANDALAEVVVSAGFPVFRGSEEDVLSRYAGAAREHQADTVVRLTGDCPLMDPALVDELVEEQIKRGVDYATNVKPPTYPDGLDISVFTRSLLEAAHAEARLGSEREHVVPWMWKQTPLEGGDRYTAYNHAAATDRSGLRLTVDEGADYLFMRQVVDLLGSRAGHANLSEILKILDNNPHLAAYNASIVRDEGYAKSLLKDKDSHG